MRKTVLWLCTFLVVNFSFSQLIINEIDVDTPGTDRMEIIEIKSDISQFSLNGYVLVLFNGSDVGGDSSYYALDLDGYVTDINGVLLIGGPDVSPVPEIGLLENTLQNGADAIAIYQANATDFPEGTIATTTNLIDAVVYDTDDADDTNLMTLLGVTSQINENENGNKTIESIQRKNDGTYEVKTPTPGMLNDGSGIQFNGISFTTSTDQYIEGESITIVFTTETNVTKELVLDFSVTNGGFLPSDYSGSTTITIPAGMNTAMSTIQVIDDFEDEGDEVMKIVFGVIPFGYNRLNDGEEIRIVDNDYTRALWGTPLNPTYGMVSSTAPFAYYDTLEGLSSALLIQAVQDIIADPTTVRAQTYADAIDILKRADQSPLNSNKVWLLYTEQQRAKLDFQISGGSNVGKWNREHTYPRSRGGFTGIEADDIADGIDIFTTTRSDSLRHANSDAHGLRAVDGPENSSRGNRDYGEYSGPIANQGSWKGDVARAVLFLSIRYNGLEVVQGDPMNNIVGELGDLETLLDWHRIDPPDDFEMNRNNIIYTWQFNRNPFIDLPDLVEYIWGNRVGDIWSHTLDIQENNPPMLIIYPNPTDKNLYIEERSLNKSKVRIYNVLGGQVYEQEFIGRVQLNTGSFSRGVYTVRIVTGNRITQKQIVIN